MPDQINNDLTNQPPATGEINDVKYRYYTIVFEAQFKKNYSSLRGPGNLLIIGGIVSCVMGGIDIGLREANQTSFLQGHHRAIILLAAGFCALMVGVALLAVSYNKITPAKADPPNVAQSPVVSPQLGSSQ